MHFLLVDNGYEQNVACFWYSVLNAKVLVANFNREMALVGAFSMIVNFLRTFVRSSIAGGSVNRNKWAHLLPASDS